MKSIEAIGVLEAQSGLFGPLGLKVQVGSLTNFEPI